MYRIEEWMAHVGASNALTLEILLFDRQDSEDMIDVTTHLSHPPTSPRPKLGWAVVIHGDAVFFSSLGDVPVKPGEIDENDCVDISFSKQVFGLIREREEMPQFRQHLEQTDHRMLREIKIDLTTRLLHRRTTKSPHRQLRIDPLQFSSQTGRMLIAAGFADREKKIVDIVAPEPRNDHP